MKKITFLLLLFAGMANAQIVNIPDVNFKAKLISLGIDSNTNGDIETSEAAVVTYLDLTSSAISDMTGIEAFTGLTYLTCFGNNFPTLDLTNSPNLAFLYCNENHLSVLNINGLTNLQVLNCMFNQLTSLDASGLTSLTELNCKFNLINTLNITGTNNLTILECSANQLTSLVVSSLSNLETLHCDYNQISSLAVTGLNLVDLDCSGNNLTAIDVSGLTTLKKFSCYNNHITLLSLAGLDLTELNCGYNQLSSLDVSTQTNLTMLQCDYNQLPSLNVSGLVNLSTLDCSQNQIPTLDLTGMNNLTTLQCWNNQLTTLDINSFTNLTFVTCNGNQLTTLDVSALVNLTGLICAFNQLTSLDVSTLTNLYTLNCSSNFITSLDLSNNNELRGLNCSINQLTTLNVSNLTHLESLICGNNAIPNVDFSGLTDLYELFVDSTGRTSIDVSNQPLLRTLFCGNNPISVVDVSGLTQLNLLDVGGPGLTQLFMKNGRNEFLNTAFTPNLQLVCADASQLSDVLNKVNASGGGAATVTSYCTFVPGGNYNTITGFSRFDLNNNGCDAADVPTNNLKFNIFDGTINEASVVNPSAEYAFYTAAGNFTVTPQLENPIYFNISPATVDFNFPALDSSVQTQDFCVTANGIHPDLEIVLMPVGAARPGFDSQYQLVYKNKGNQTLSGTVNLIFDDSRTDFISALPTVNSQTLNSLIWNYTDLQPFESRVIYFTLNVNSSVESPAVNDGDFLDFTANINFATGDETPLDNVSVLHQKVVNSMDPNVKTCLEGDVVSPQEIGGYLHYNIEFENLGTASAVNVVVKDIIDTNMFDINSLQVLYASHEMRASIRENVVEFVFENINLAPADGNPPVGGHGNVLFKIKTLPTLTAGAQVENRANIYFDYNAPIETNAARTTFQTLSNPDFNTDQSIVMYPNPAKSHVSINCDSMIKTVELFDIQGRILQMAIANSDAMMLDISDKSSGIYFVKVTTEKGQMVTKIIKE
jgi:uncharacterized repeat protein (TIGR01451 family)